VTEYNRSTQVQLSEPPKPPGRDVDTMKPSSINTGILSILCATSLTMTMITPVMTTTPPLTAPPTATKTPPLVLVSTLTPQTVKNFTNLYGQLLTVKFTPAQQQNIQGRLSKEWMTNLGLRQNVTQTLAMEKTILRGTPTEVTQLQTKTVSKLRQQVVDGDVDALWMVSFYDAVPKNWVVAGEPPLTQMTTEIGADALCFMVNEIMGRAVATNNTQLKNSVTAKLKLEYKDLPASTKQQLSRLPANWIKFKNNEWYALGDEFREELRVQWGQNLEAYIPEIRDMTNLRRERLARLKSDPTNPWGQMNSLQRQVALLKPDVTFQNGLRMFARLTPIQLNNYVSMIDMGKSIGTSPTRYAVNSTVKPIVKPTTAKPTTIKSNVKTNVK
jgi:hypothetical protein